MRLLALLLPFIPNLLGAPSPSVSASTTLAQSAVAERVDFVYYDIRGDSPHALASALATHGPEFDGHRFFGMTEWSLTADYRPEQRADGCALAEIQVEIDIETQLPHWRESEDGDGALRLDWYQFLGSLDQHERGHRNLAREAAQAVRLRLARMRTASCETIRRDAHWVAVDVMNEYDARHRTYDSSTGHGHTQGAVWPRSARPAEALLAHAD